MTPAISIIMPAFDAERFIETAIESILAQSFQDWELLVIDDGSEDGTPKRVAAFSDPRVVYTRVDHCGAPSRCRNVGLAMARGEFVAFLDADDAYYPDTLETLRQPMLEDGRIFAVYGFCTNMDENGRPLPALDDLRASGGGTYELPAGHSHSWEAIVLGRTNFMFTLMLRRSVAARIGGFNEELFSADDYEYFVRLFLHDRDGVCCLPRYVYKYRNHQTSRSKSRETQERRLESRLKVVNWQLTRANFPVAIEPLRSRMFAAAYAGISGGCLLQGQGDLTRLFALRALGDSNISKMDWVKRLLPLLVRSVLPREVNVQLTSLAYRIRGAGG